MRDLYLLAGALLFGISSLKAQTVLEYTINQAPILVANAGIDKTILKGGQTILGGAPTATGGSGIYIYLWTPSQGLNQANIANPIASPLNTTTYTLTLNDGKKCSIISSTLITVNSTLGVEDMKDEIYLQIFPNPNKGSFVIMSGKSIGAGKVLIEVFNAAGMLVYSESVSELKKTSKTINLPNVSTGLYLLRLSGSELNISKTLLIQ